VHSPKIERIEVASRGDVRRAKLYYLRGRVGRRARVRERQFAGPGAREAALGTGELLEVPDEGGATDAEGVTVAEADVAVAEPEDAATADAPEASADTTDAPDASVETTAPPEESADAADAPADTAQAGDGGDADSAAAETEADADDSETRGS
jgi:large subunit ribosomal protein L19